MNRRSGIFLVTGAIVWLALLLPACVGRPPAIEPIQEPMESELAGTARAIAPEVTSTRGTPTGTPVTLSGAKETPLPAPPAGEGIVTADPTAAGGQDPDVSRLVMLAKEDLARRLEIPIDSIDVVAIIRQEFPAGAFYCLPAKGRIARDEPLAVIPGEGILLSATGRRYEYHASEQTVVFCRQLP